MSKGARVRAGRTRDDLTTRRRLVRLVYFATREDEIRPPRKNRHQRRKEMRLNRI